MCYVHPIYPSLCSHNYYILLAICGPNASLHTCPSSSLIVTGPPGWDGRPKRIENGLCPRCDLGNEGVDLSRIRFYKPAKPSKKQKQKNTIVISDKLNSRGSDGTEVVEAGLTGMRPGLGERWSFEGNTLPIASKFCHNQTSSFLVDSRLGNKGISYKASVQSLPTLGISQNRGFNGIPNSIDMFDYSSDTEDEDSSPLDCSGHRRGLDRARRFWLKKSSTNLKHLHGNNSSSSSSSSSSPSSRCSPLHSPSIQAEKKKTKRGGKRRYRLRTALRGMVQGLEDKLGAHSHQTGTTSERDTIPTVPQGFKLG